jgi:DNA-binding response OmpR family regulator
MSPPKSMILVLARTGADATAVIAPLQSNGFAVECQPIPTSGRASWPQHQPAVVVFFVDEAPQTAIAFTRRLRADTTAEPLPILWMLTLETLDSATEALDFGADACLVHPVASTVLVAQVNALLRIHQTLGRFAAKGANSQDQTERLQKLYRVVESDAKLCRDAILAFQPRGEIRIGEFTLCWKQRTGTLRCGSILNVHRSLDGIRFVLIDVGGLSSTSGAVIATGIAEVILRELEESPSSGLTQTNERLAELALPDSAVIAVLAGFVSSKTGQVSIACGGLPSPVLVPRDRSASLWSGSGSFLGTTGAVFHDMNGQMTIGEKLVMIAGDAVVDRRPDVRAAAETFRLLPAQSFTDVLAQELLSDADAESNFTLLVIDRDSIPMESNH